VRRSTANQALEKTSTPFTTILSDRRKGSEAADSLTESVFDASRSGSIRDGCCHGDASQRKWFLPGNWNETPGQS
jgi:hypothetical protein